MGDFGEDTEVRAVPGGWRAQLSRDWEIWGPNGGYVAAVALRAAGAASELPRPISFAGHFLSVADFEEVTLEVTTLRRAKHAESLRVSMTQAGKPVFEALVWAGADGLSGLEHAECPMPAAERPRALPSVEELLPPDARRTTFPFWDNLECRPINWVLWEDREPGPAHALDWYRFRPRPTFDDPWLDAARSLLLIDTMVWPAACRHHVRQEEFVAPSLDVRASFHALEPQSEYLLVDARSPVGRDGLVGGEAAVFSESGTLLASGAAQLLCRPVRNAS